MSTSITNLLNQSILLTSGSARLDVELLLCHVLSCDRIYLRSWPENLLNIEQIHAFELLFDRRKSGEPMAYILGERAFWDLDLQVSPDTLIPRPDTEIVVEQALSLDLPDTAKVLDLGTGTGAIALSLASERAAWNIMGTDCFPSIITLAESNAIRNNLKHVKFICSAWFEAISESNFNLIVSNPPYIDGADPHLLQGDVCFEPRSALVSGKMGLEDIELIIEQARNYLCRGGWLILEHGYQQAEAIQNFFSQTGYQSIETVKDYGGQDRVTRGRYD